MVPSMYTKFNFISVEYATENTKRGESVKLGI